MTVSVALFFTPPPLAEMLEVAGLGTVAAVTTTVPPLAPSATTSVAGTVATAVEPEAIATDRPPGGAGAFSVTVATEVPPLETVAGDRAMLATATPGVMLSVADLLTVFAVAVRLAEVTAVTLEVETVTLRVEVPEGTTTLAGTVAAPLPLVIDTWNPSAGAGPVSVMIAVAGLPPTTLDWASFSEERAGGLTVRVAVLLRPYVAVRVTATWAATGEVVAVKVPLVVPPGTVTVEGTVTAGSLAESATVTPPGGAAAESVTVPVEDAPPITLPGDSASEEADSTVTDTVAVLVTPFDVAERVTVAAAVTAEVDTGKVALLVPPATVTLAGTDATEG